MKVEEIQGKVVELVKAYYFEQAEQGELELEPGTDLFELSGETMTDWKLHYFVEFIQDIEDEFGVSFDCDDSPGSHGRKPERQAVGEAHYSLTHSRGKWCGARGFTEENGVRSSPTHPGKLANWPESGVLP